jgi:tetratricopeptide (TPR) repeat protein
MFMTAVLNLPGPQPLMPSDSTGLMSDQACVARELSTLRSDVGRVGHLVPQQCRTIIHHMTVSNKTNNAGELGVPGMLKPSAFMRKLRPDIYSDSTERNTYVLSAAQLEYRLGSITSRNETHAFEIFCRKLCERAICPNLRPQTGPDGGGDSKADSETFPVADEIAELTYVGSANSGQERWAFAFSAKETWAAKARDDVDGIVATERRYDRITFVTNRFAKAKDRARIEDELTKKHRVPVTILDRTWIVNEIVDKDRTDLAFNYLKVGEESRTRRQGPTDYSRNQQLDDIEQGIANPERFQGMECQLVTEALVAAKLSRNLERPRFETDGRFARAIRAADEYGTSWQKLEVRYEQLWTAYWWFDDVGFLNDAYDSFEKRAVAFKHSRALELLGNLHQLLVNSIVHGLLTRTECWFDDRTAKLKQALDVGAGDASRPNNSLEAKTGLLRMELNRATMAHDTEALSALWQEYGDVLERARGLGEFDAESLVRLIEVAGEVAGNDPAYNNLVEKLADFVSARRSEAEGALILLKRARKLDFADKLDMIRWLGKAAVGLSKREYTEELIEALQLLTLAYRSAGLLWASRASCIFALATIVIEANEGELPVSIVATTKLWAWNALQLSHLPDLLSALQLMNGLVVTLPLSEASKAKVESDIRELDLGLGCLFLNLGEAEIRQLEGVPDILKALDLFMARTALLASLGYEDELRLDGSIPKSETDEGVAQLLSVLKSQPVADELRGPLILNGGGRQTFATTIIGMKVRVERECSQLWKRTSQP